MTKHTLYITFISSVKRLGEPNSNLYLIEEKDSEAKIQILLVHAKNLILQRELQRLDDVFFNTG
jgi:hypothetical protein